MKMLEVDIQSEGYTYNLIKRSKKACLYEQWLGLNISGHLVFEIKISPETINNSGLTEELFPDVKAINKWAWIYKRLLPAIKKFDELDNIKRGSKTIINTQVELNTLQTGIKNTHIKDYKETINDDNVQLRLFA